MIGFNPSLRGSVSAVLTAALLIVAEVPMVAPSTAQASWPGANGRIAFVRYGELKNDIWTMNPDGSDEHAITDFTPGGEPQICPDGLIGCNGAKWVRWSPDATRLAFVWTQSIGPFGQGNYDRLVTMNADGSNMVQVTCNPLEEPDSATLVCHGQDTQPAWSPDATRLVYAHLIFGDPYYQIYVTPVGSHLLPGQALTALPGDSEFPVWSPDGTKIAFLHSDDPSSLPFHVWVMNANGSSATDLMPSAPLLETATFNRIDWSPDGTQITYAGYNKAIWVVGADGNARHAVTRPANQFHRNPAWSPDGKRIAFECDPPLTVAEIYEVNADGTGQRRITFNTLPDTAPDWGSSTSALPAPPTTGVPDGCEEPPSGTTSTTTTYTGDGSGQYSDPVTLSGVLQDSSTTPAVAIAGRTLAFTVGTQQTSAGPTGVNGTTSTSLVLNQKPGSASTVATEFGGDATYARSSDNDPFAILKEDCTLVYSGATLVAATERTNLAAEFGELDTSLGNLANKTVTFTATNASGQTQNFTAVTDATGHAATSAALPADVYGVSVAFSGDDYYNPCSTSADVLVTVQAAQAKVTGGGWISIASGRTSFGFNAIPEAGGLWKGQIQIRATNNKSNFHGNVVLTLTSAGNTATWSGTGYWLGLPNYGYTVSVVDNGSSSKKTDTISIVIKDPRGATVYSTNGVQVLKGGNIVVH